MLVKTKGIILRTVKFRESSLILDAYTEELGLVTLIINGVRSKKSNKIGLYQVMNFLEFVLYYNEQKDIHRIKEAKVHDPFFTIPFEIKKGAVGLFCIEVIYKTIKEKEKNTQLYEFIQNNFTFLDHCERELPLIPLFFLIHFSKLLGFGPQGHYSKSFPYFDIQSGVFINQNTGEFVLTENQSIMLSKINSASLNNLAELSFKREDRNFLIKKLELFYRIHFDLKKFQVPDILGQVFGG